MGKQHYDSISSQFEKHWFFTDDYFPTFIKMLVEGLALEPSHEFADFGCGVGHFTEAIVCGSASPKNVLGIDYSQNMIERFQALGKIFRGRVQDVEQFVAETSHRMDRILMKEMIHHVKDLDEFFQNVCRVLSERGFALIVTRPSKTQFPFFRAALEKFSDGQPPYEEISRSIERSGLKVELEIKKIPIKLTKSRLFEMILARFMSIFRDFSDSDLEQGIEELEKRFSKIDEIRFDDELLFIKAIK